MLDQLDTAFGGHGEVIAPTHKQGYSASGGASMVTDEVSMPYVVEEPGNATVSAGKIGTRFRANYPDVPASQWPSLLRAVRRNHEREVSFEWSGVQPPADNAAVVIARLGDLRLTVRIPPNDAALIAQERGNHGRPDAYTWTVEGQVTGIQLVRRVVRQRTEWTIERRVRDATGVAHPPETDRTFTAIPPQYPRRHRRHGRPPDIEQMAS